MSTLTKRILIPILFRCGASGQKAALRIFLQRDAEDTAAMRRQFFARDGSGTIPEICHDMSVLELPL